MRSRSPRSLRPSSRALGLNVALTEAIALGHDCGHGPGGHASEDALSPYVEGGFDHAVWGADVTLAALNLCRETIDGIRNHSWSRPAPATPEGEVVSWADRIAYVCHDFEDAVAAGIVSVDMLPARVRERCGTRRSQQLGAFIAAMIDAAGDVRAHRHDVTDSPRRSPSSASSTTSTCTCVPPPRAGAQRHRVAPGVGRALRRPAEPAARRRRVSTPAAARRCTQLWRTWAG